MITKIKEQLQVRASRAYAPYSNFHVAALFELKDGSTRIGFNIENVAYPSTICAERAGIFSMLIEGVNPKNDVQAVHIYGQNSDDYLTPCGGCLQVLAEFLLPTTPFYLHNKDFTQTKETKLQKLMPLLISKGSVINARRVK